MATVSDGPRQSSLERVTNSVSQTSAPQGTRTDEGPWLSAQEMADRVRVNLRTIQRLANAGRIAHHRIPGTTLIRFSPADVLAFDAEAQQVPA